MSATRPADLYAAISRTTNSERNRAQIPSPTGLAAMPQLLPRRSSSDKKQPNLPISQTYSLMLPDRLMEGKPAGTPKHCTARLCPLWPFRAKTLATRRGTIQAPATQTKAHKGIHNVQAPATGAGSTRGEVGFDHPTTSAPSGAVNLTKPAA